MGFLNFKRKLVSVKRGNISDRFINLSDEFIDTIRGSRTKWSELKYFFYLKKKYVGRIEKGQRFSPCPVFFYTLHNEELLYSKN